MNKIIYEIVRKKNSKEIKKQTGENRWRKGKREMKDVRKKR